MIMLHNILQIGVYFSEIFVRVLFLHLDLFVVGML